MLVVVVLKRQPLSTGTALGTACSTTYNPLRYVYDSKTRLGCTMCVATVVATCRSMRSMQELSCFQRACGQRI